MSDQQEPNTPRGDRPMDTPRPEPIPLEPMQPGPARIDAPRLIDELDDDADLEHDPEVERAVRGIPLATPVPGEPESHEPKAELVTPGVASWKVMAGIGAGLVVAATVLAAINHWPERPTPSRAFIHVLLTLYDGVLHTATGVGATLAAAFFTGRRHGRFDLAASRMLVSVGVFLLVFNLRTPIPGMLDEVVLASAAYAGTIFLLFRLPARETGVLCAAHFGLWLAVAVGGHLQRSVADPDRPPPAVADP